MSHHHQIPEAAAVEQQPGNVQNCLHYTELLDLPARNRTHFPSYRNPTALHHDSHTICIKITTRPTDFVITANTNNAENPISTNPSTHHTHQPIIV
jgi:hypothetical protein